MAMLMPLAWRARRSLSGLLCLALGVAGGPAGRGAPAPREPTREAPGPDLVERLRSRHTDPGNFLASLAARPLDPIDLVVVWDVHPVRPTVFANRLYAARAYRTVPVEATIFILDPGVRGARDPAAIYRVASDLFTACPSAGGPLLATTGPEARIIGFFDEKGRGMPRVRLPVLDSIRGLWLDPFSGQVLEEVAGILIRPQGFPSARALQLERPVVRGPDGTELEGSRLMVVGPDALQGTQGVLTTPAGPVVVMTEGPGERELLDELRSRSGLPVGVHRVAFPRAVLKVLPGLARIEGDGLRLGPDALPAASRLR